MEQLFKALADPTRLLMLDRLRERNGQTLRELCEHLAMARQSATQHLDILVRVNLVTVVRRGRERLHHLNPAEEDAMTSVSEIVPTYLYVTYIHASAEQVWRALTDADLTARFWGHANVSDWQPGSSWEHRRVDGSGIDVVGKVLTAEPPTRLVITFEDSPREAREPSVVTFLVEPHHDIVRLTVTHEHLPNMDMYNGIAGGWPAVLSNLKSLLETGAALPQSPWEMTGAHA
jgi:uncharacterized protein YndB with AHSA1/START domain